MKVMQEFYCSECTSYFDIKLNMSIDGNYRVICPKCEHEHYRAINNGVITGDRFPSSPYGLLIEDIRPMKSSIREKQKETSLESEYDTTTAGFLHRLWKEIYGERAAS